MAPTFVLPFHVPFLLSSFCYPSRSFQTRIEPPREFLWIRWLWIIMSESTTQEWQLSLHDAWLDQIDQMVSKWLGLVPLIFGKPRLTTQIDSQVLTSAVSPVTRWMYLARAKMAFFIYVGWFRCRYPNLNTLWRAKMRMLSEYADFSSRNLRHPERSCGFSRNHK